MFTAFKGSQFYFLFVFGLHRFVFTFTKFSVSVGTGCILVNCRPDTCDGNWCTRCKDGYYLDTTRVAVDGRHYCSICPASCSSCDGYDDCSGCNAGRYGNLCLFSCSGCKDNICDKDSDPAVMAASVVTTGKLMIHAASVPVDVHSVPDQILVLIVKMYTTGEKRVNIHVITVKIAAKLMGVYPAVIMVTIENTTPTNKVMHVSSVDRPVRLALRTISVNYVGLGAGDPHVRLSVQTTALNVHQIQLVQVV